MPFLRVDDVSLASDEASVSQGERAQRCSQRTVDDLKDSDPLAVECVQCGAAPRVHCTDYRRKRCATHARRGTVQPEPQVHEEAPVIRQLSFFNVEK